MSVANKLLQAAAGNAGEVVYVDDVFSTYLYEGNGSTQTITNGIDIAGEGGMIWFKARDQSYSHQIFDSERNSYGTALSTNDNGKGDVRTNYVTGVNNDGFDLGAGGFVNNSGVDFASWTFRKASNFFTMVKYTGNGTAGHTISHDLGGTPGCIWIKRIDDGDPWRIWHRGFSNTTTKYMNTFGAVTEQTDTTYWNSTAPTSTNFTLGTNNAVNRNGAEFIAYIFAHHDGDGTFGEDSDEDIIECGVYSGLNSGAEISLGFEPQFLILKRRDGSNQPWKMVDIMRGFPAGSSDETIALSTNAAESSITLGHPTPNGFIIDSGDSDYITSSGEYIYIAIRRPNKPASEFAATNLFHVEAMVNSSSSEDRTVDTGFDVDSLFLKVYDTSSQWYWADRIRGTGNLLRTDSIAAEDTNTNNWFKWDTSDGISEDLTSWNDDRIYYAFRRVPGFFDIVTFEGNATARTINHNLGVVPEMMVVKCLSTNGNWMTYHSGANGGTNPEDYYYALNLTFAQLTDNDGSVWNSTAPTATQFSVGTASYVNANNQDFIAYLFASVDGISKVGTYTGSGSTQTIDCGFSNGARFVFIKNSSGSANWFVWDSARGITSGLDNYLILNQSAAQTTNSPVDVNPASSGFEVFGNDGDSNKNNDVYLFYAIA